MVFELDIEKKEMRAKQFPVEEILNEKDRIVRGWMSVEVKDTQGEVVPVSDLRRTLNTWMKRGAPITDQHSNRVIGRGLRWNEEEHPKSKQQGIIIDYQIHEDYSIDDQVWDEIKSGKRKGLSFGGRALKKPKLIKDEYTGETARKLGGLEAYEVASVQDPANEFSENIMVNFLAKGKESDTEKKLINDLQKGYSVKDISKPFVGFKNFDECVISQQERGHGEESSQRICGWLKHRTEKEWMENKTDHNPEKDLSSSEDSKLNGEKMSEKKLNKQEEEPKKPKEEEDEEEEKQERPEWADELISEIKNLIEAVTASKEEDEEDKKPEEEEEEKQEEEPKKPKEEETEKEEAESTEESAESTEEAAEEEKPAEEEKKPEDEADKMKDLIDKRVNEILKKKGITKVSTPRPGTNVVKNKQDAKQELALELLEKAKKGEITQAEMNRMTKTFVNKQYEKGLRELLGKEE